MGKIVLVVGSHAVGKTTLFEFAKKKDEFIVFDGIKIPTDGYDLRKREDFLAYENLYLKSINENNGLIKRSNRNGLVVRSIEEASYYYHFYEDPSVEEEYKTIFADEDNIKVDKIVFLDADRATLQFRYQNDKLRDMEETITWYKNEYERYISYWKNYPGVVTINTVNKTVATIYDEIKKTLVNHKS